MLSLVSVSAWIEVDGKELEQYGVEEDPDHRQVTCWIATQVDQNFSVVFRDDAVNRDHSLCSDLKLDGSSVGGKVLRPSLRMPGMSPVDARTVTHRDRLLSATSIRPFKFSKLELTGIPSPPHVTGIRIYALTEEDEYLDQVSAHLGEIQLRIYRAQYCGRDVFKGVVGEPSHGKVHERSKKAVTHCVSYGQEVQTPTQYGCTVKYLDGYVPLVTFIFKYRDSGLLQANGIIPKPPPTQPTPKKLVVCEDAFDFTAIGNIVKPEAVDEEIEIVDDTPQRQKKSVVATKRLGPNRDSEARPAKRIKREKKLVLTGDFIDLT